MGGYNVRADANYNLIAQLQQDPRLIEDNFDFSKLAIGMQTHLYAEHYPDESAIAWKAEQTQANMERFKNDLGVDVYVTEFDVKVHNVPGDLDYKQQHQALIYRYMTRAALAAGSRYIGIWEQLTRHIKIIGQKRSGLVVHIQTLRFLMINVNQNLL